MVIKINVKARDIFYPYLYFFVLLSSGACLGALINVLQQSYISIIDIIILLIFILLFFIILSFSYIRNVKKEGILGEHTFEITPNYFREATLYNDDKHDWHTVKKIKKSKQTIAIACSWTVAFFIPRREFSTTEEYNKFYDLAVSYYKQAKKAAN